MTMRASNIQKILLAPAKKERLQNLVTEPSLVCLPHAIDPLITPPPPGRPFATSPTLKTPTWWTEEYNIPFLLKGIISNVESEKGQAFLNLPRILYRLKSPEFVVAMQRHLRIPIHRKQVMPRCRCNKADMDIFGDYIFNCIMARGRTFWHHSVRDMFRTLFKRV